MNRSFNGRGIIAILLGIFILFATTSMAATMPGFVRLQPVTANLTAPTAVALDGNENIYVTESSMNNLHIYTQGGEYIKSLNGLDMPASVAVDANGRIYVGNNATGNVEVYDAGLALLLKLGDGDGEFQQPASIAIASNGRIYVADSVNDWIRVYNSDGTLYSTIGSPGSGDGEFNFPTGVAINETDGELIVADRQLNQSLIEGARVQVLDLNGTFKRSFGTFGVGEGLLLKPVGVAVDGEGRIYVVDAMQHVVHVFDGDGISLGTIHDVDDPMRTPLYVVYGGSNRLFVTSLKTDKLEIFGLGSYTNMSTSPLTLAFSGDEGGADPAQQSVVITNNGSGTLNWTATSDSSWISLSAASGSSAVSGNSALNIGAGLSGLSAGTYTGHVTINSGNSAADIVTVNLTINELPTLTANAGGPYSAEEGEAVLLNGSSSSGSISLYEWDVDDDGTYEYSTTSSTQSHTYTLDGTYTVRLRISDAGSNTAEDTATATISDSTPTAAFTADTLSGTGYFTIIFANNSTGYDQTLTYEWDFDEDGAIDSTLENPSYIYTVPDTYDVTLTVTDADGSTDTLTKTNYITMNAGIPGCEISPIKNGSTFYMEVQSACNAASEDETIQIQGIDMYEDLNLSGDVTVTIKGGYNCDYTATSGMTTINGDITITTGTIMLDDIIIQ